MNIINIEDRAQNAIRVAYCNLGGNMKSSAQHCLDMAMNQFFECRFESAFRWAKKSLAYSVGVTSTIYDEVAA